MKTMINIATTGRNISLPIIPLQQLQRLIYYFKKKGFVIPANISLHITWSFKHRIPKAASNGKIVAATPSALCKAT